MSARLLQHCDVAAAADDDDGGDEHKDVDGPGGAGDGNDG